MFNLDHWTDMQLLLLLGAFWLVLWAAAALLGAGLRWWRARRQPAAWDPRGNYRRWPVR